VSHPIVCQEADLPRTDVNADTRFVSQARSRKDKCNERSYPAAGMCKCAFLAYGAVIYAPVSDYPQPKLKKRRLEILRLRVPAVAHFLILVWYKGKGR
jgi:hypothetical protein